MASEADLKKGKMSLEDKLKADAKKPELKLRKEMSPMTAALDQLSAVYDQESLTPREKALLESLAEKRKDVRAMQLNFGPQHPVRTNASANSYSLPSFF